MKFRVTVVAAAAVAIAGVGAGVAVAETGDQAAPWLRVDRPDVNAGDTAEFEGGCDGGVAHVMSEALVDGEATVEQGDPFTAVGTIADVLPGEYEVVLRCSGENPDIEPVMLSVL